MVAVEGWVVVGGRVEDVEKFEGRGEAVAMLDVVGCDMRYEAFVGIECFKGWW